MKITAIIGIFAILSIIILAGCATQTQEETTPELTEKEMEEKAMQQQEAMDETTSEHEEVTGQMEQEEAKEEENQGPLGWKDTPLKDIRTGETYKISDFAGKTILLESFAVWCPICTKQQKILKTMRGSEGDSIVHISLDTDPGEDEGVVKRHIEKHGFEWYYSVPPKEFTQQLIDEFGLTIVSAPSAPILLICEDLSTRFLKKRGAKSAEELLSEIASGC